MVNQQKYRNSKGLSIYIEPILQYLRQICKQYGPKNQDFSSYESVVKYICEHKKELPFTWSELDNYLRLQAYNSRTSFSCKYFHQTIKPKFFNQNKKQMQSIQQFTFIETPESIQAKQAGQQTNIFQMPTNLPQIKRHQEKQELISPIVTQKSQLSDELQNQIRLEYLSTVVQKKDFQLKDKQQLIKKFSYLHQNRAIYQNIVNFINDIYTNQERTDSLAQFKQLLQDPQLDQNQDSMKALSELCQHFY